MDRAAQQGQLEGVQAAKKDHSDSKTQQTAYFLTLLVEPVAWQGLQQDGQQTNNANHPVKGNGSGMQQAWLAKQPFLQSRWTGKDSWQEGKRLDKANQTVRYNRPSLTSDPSDRARDLAQRPTRPVK